VSEVVKHKEAELDDKGFLVHMSDLKHSYREEYRKVKESIRQADEAETHQYYEETGKCTKQEHPDTSIKEGMLEDLNIAINWMHTGRNPWNKRGVERRGAYEIDNVPDPLAMQAFHADYTSRSSSTLTEDDEKAIRDALDKLSDQERACYVMSRAYCIPFDAIANALAISKGSVQAYVKRAEQKLKQGFQVNLF
jgi:positive control factor